MSVAGDLLQQRSSNLARFASSLGDALMFSSELGVVVKAGAIGAKAAELAHHVSQILSLTDEFCSTLRSRIELSEQRQADLAGLLHQRTTPRISKEEASSVVALLKHSGMLRADGLGFIDVRMGFSPGLHGSSNGSSGRGGSSSNSTSSSTIRPMTLPSLGSNNSNNLVTQTITIDQLDFSQALPGQLEQSSKREAVINACRELHAILEKDRTPEREAISSELTTMITSQIINRVQGQIVAPIAGSVAALSARSVTEKLIEVGDSVLAHFRDKAEARKAKLEAFMQSEANSVAAGEQPTTLWDRIKEFFGIEGYEEVIENLPKRMNDKQPRENITKKPEPVTNERKAKALKSREDRQQREEQKLVALASSSNSSSGSSSVIASDHDNKVSSSGSNSSNTNTLINNQQRGVKKFAELLNLSTSNNINTSASAQLPLYQASDSLSQNNNPMFSFGPDAYADGGIATTATIELPSVFDFTVAGAARYAPRTLSVLGEASIGGLIVGGTYLTIKALNNAAHYESQHLWTSDDFNDLITNPLIPWQTKEKMFAQMTNDLGRRSSGSIYNMNYAAIDTTPKAITGNISTNNSFGQDLKIGDGFAAINPEQPQKRSLPLNNTMDQTGRGRPFILPGFDVDPEAGKIKTLWTPYQSDEIRRLTTLPGFDIDPEAGKIKTNWTPIREVDPWDYINYTPDQRGLFDSQNIFYKKPLDQNKVKDVSSRLNINKEWQSTASKSGDGIKFRPTISDDYNEVRIMNGRPNSNFPGQQVDYVKIMRNGQYRDIDGNIVNQASQESHIPLNGNEQVIKNLIKNLWK